MSVIIQVGITAGFNYITPVGSLTIQNLERPGLTAGTVRYRVKMIALGADITERRQEYEPWNVDHRPGDGVWALIGKAMLGLPKEE